MIHTQRIFWNNVIALVTHRQGRCDLPTLEKLTGISTSTIWQQQQCLRGMGLNYVEQIAESLQVEPWQLLVPGFDPTNLPASITQKQKQALSELTT